MVLITLTEYKQSAGISSPNQDTELQSIVDFVNEFVSDYVGYSAEFSYYAEDESVILLNSSQVITSITGNILVDGVLTNGVVITGFTQAGFKLILPSAVTGLLTCVLAAAPNNAALKQACFLLVKHYSKEEYKSQMQIGSEQVEVADTKSLPMHIKAVLDLYRES